MVVDALGSQTGVELTVVAVLVLSLEVVDAVGDIASLLDLGQEAALADAMDTSGRQIETVAFLTRQE